MKSSTKKIFKTSVITAAASLGRVNTQTAPMPERDLAFWRFFMRDTAQRMQARSESASFFAKRAEQRKTDREEGVADRHVVEIPSDLIFFWRVIGLLRGLCTTLASSHAVPSFAGNIAKGGWRYNRGA